MAAFDNKFVLGKHLTTVVNWIRANFLGKEAEAASAAKLANTTEVGSATHPVYFTNGGVPSATTYELNKSVPADAQFTDTTYADVVAGSATSGLMTGADKTRLDGIADGAQANVIEGITIGGADASIDGDKKVALGNAAAATTESTLTNGSNLPTGAAVQGYVTGLGYQTASDVSAAIGTAIAAVYKPAGSVAFASLPALGAGVLGNVYNVTDGFTTTADFLEGTGKAYAAGTNVVVVDADETGESPSYKFDVLPGFIDWSGTALTDDDIADILADE